MLRLAEERVVVTGASGFLGRHLMDELGSRDVSAVGLSSKDYDFSKNVRQE